MFRSFLQSHGYPDVVVSRDLETDPMPNEMVWSRVIGPAVEALEGLYQYEVFQVSVSCKGNLDKSDRQRSSELTALLRAYINSPEFLVLPITNIAAGSGAYPTNELDGYSRPAYTFSMSVYQTTTKLNV
jgi:hypothetical protein